MTARACFDRLSMRKARNGMKGGPQPELVEGRTKPIQANDRFLGIAVLDGADRPLRNGRTMPSGASRRNDRRSARSRGARGPLGLCAFAVVLAVTVLAGCSSTAMPDARLETSPAVEPLPMALGVYYPPELRDFHFSHNFGDGGIIIDYILGPPSITLFDQVLSAMFARTVSSAEDPARSSGNADVAATIALRIERFQPSYRAGGVSPLEFIDIEIVYRATLFSSPGHRVADWTIGGFGSGRPLAFSWSDDTGAVAAIAMRNAAASFIAGFRQQPEVAKWLAGLGLAPASPAP